MALTLPPGWANPAIYTAQKKIEWFNANGVTPDDLASAGVTADEIDWMLANGLNRNPTKEVENKVSASAAQELKAQADQAYGREATQDSSSASTPAVDTSSAVDRLSDFLDQAASNTGIYEGKQALEEAIADIAGSQSVADKATLYNQLNDNYSDTQIKDAIAEVTGKPVTDTDWNYLTGAAKVQEIVKDPKATVQQKAELYNDLQELFPTQSNQFLNDLINTVAPEQKAEDLKYLAAASDVQDVVSGTVQDKAKVYNNLLDQGFDAATAANIIKDATGQAPTAKDMGYLTDAAKVQSLATSTDPNAKADFYNELLKRYDPTAIGNLFTDALGKQQSASDMKYLMELAQQRQTAATTAQTELEKQQAADKAAADRQKTAIDAATQAQEAARKAAAGSTFSTGITYGADMGADRKGTGVDISGESGLRGAYAPYVERMLERASAEADVPFQKYTGSSPLLESARAGIANLTTPAQFLQGQNLAQAAGIGALDYGKYKPTSFTTGTFANPNFASQLSPADLKNQAAQKPPGFFDGGGVNTGMPNYDSFLTELPYFGSASNSQNYDPNFMGMIGDMQYRGGRETQAQRDFKLQQEGQMGNMQNMAGGMGGIFLGGSKFFDETMSLGGGLNNLLGGTGGGLGSLGGVGGGLNKLVGSKFFDETMSLGGGLNNLLGKTGGVGGVGGMGGMGDMGGGLGSLGGGLNKLVGGTGQFNGPTSSPSPYSIAYPSEPTYEERVPSIPSNPNLQPTNYGGQNVTNVQASYMSPFMQGAVEPALREAKRQSDIMGQANAAKAVSVGAFGGSRQGLVEAERQRNLMNQLGDIQSQGLQKAYESGLGQFNTEQQRALEAQKLAEESRQFGSELGLKGLDTSIRAAQTLGGLGQQQGYLDLATLKQMADLGQQQQQFDYNEFLRGEKYPYENLTFMKNMLQGLPYNAAPTGIDPMSQALSGGISSVYLAQLLGGLGG